MIKLGIITKEISMDFEYSLKVINELNFEYVEIDSLWGKSPDELNKDEIRKVKDLIKKYNKKVSCISPGLFFRVPLQNDPNEISPYGSYKEHLEKLKRTISLAHELNTKIIKVFGFAMEFWDYSWFEKGNKKGIIETVAERFEEPTRIAEREGITLAVETCFLNNITNAYTAKKVIEELGSDYLRVCWDPANCLYYNEASYPDGYNLIKNYIVHVHIKDGIFNARKLHFKLCVPGKGNVKHYREIIKSLINNGYKGVFSLEPEYIPEGGNSEDAVRESAKEFKKILSNLQFI